MSDKAKLSVAHNINNSSCCIAINGRKLCDPDNVFTPNYISCIYEHNVKRFGPHFLTVKFITIRNLNMMSNCLVKRNNCEIPILA